MEKRIEELRAAASRALDAASTLDDVENARVRYLGKNGEITQLMKGLKDLPAEEKPKAGQLFNRLKNEVDAAIKERKATLESSQLDSALAADAFDVTEPGVRVGFGSVHPIEQTRRRLEDIFTSMGFMVLDGPEIESDYYNFEALNIPAHHPARDMQDTFWLEDGDLLRTHTSPVQIRAMETYRPPIRAIAPGRVFRYEVTDASHENTFHQLEGLVIDRDISVANLIFAMKTLLREIFERDVEIRLRPGYFPFVEPGFELDLSCLICDGGGCKVCKQSGWVELLPCGMVHPNVLRSGKIDPEEYSGFAFGLGLTRLVMMRYGIDDIRQFLAGDLRFLRQFA